MKKKVKMMLAMLLACAVFMGTFGQGAYAFAAEEKTEEELAQEEEMARIAFEAAVKELDEAFAEHEEAKNNSKIKQQEKETAEENVQSAQANLESSKENLSKAQTGMSEAEKQRTEALALLNEIQEKVTNEVADAESYFNAAAEEQQEAKTALEEVSAEYAGLVQDAKKAEEEHQQKKEALEDAIEQVQTAMANEAERAESQKIAAEQAWEEQNETVEDLSQQYADSETKYETLSQKAEEALTTLESARETVSPSDLPAQERLEKLKEEEETVRTETEEKQRDLEYLEDEIRFVEDTVIEKESLAEQKEQEVSEAKTSFDEKDSLKKNAERALEEEKEILNDARIAVEEAAKAAEEAEKALETLLNQKDHYLETVRLELEELEAQKAEVEAELETAKQNAEAAEEQIAKGSLGFFEAMGADKAVAVLQSDLNEGYTTIGAENDATSLENMKRAIDVIGLGIEYMHMMKADGYELGDDWLVTDEHMAIAQCNTNYSHVEGYHRGATKYATGTNEDGKTWTAGSASENLAWTLLDDIDPYCMWIDEEKVYWDAACEKLGIQNNDMNTMTSEERRAVMEEVANNNQEIGHYYNCVKEAKISGTDEYRTKVVGTGVAVNEHWATVGQQYSAKTIYRTIQLSNGIVKTNYSGTGFKEYTFEEYKARFMEYYDNLMDPGRQVEEAQKKLDDINQKIDEKGKAYEEALKAAQEECEVKKAALEEATIKVADKESLVEEWQLALETADGEAAAAEEVLLEKQLEQAEIQTTLNELNEQKAFLETQRTDKESELEGLRDQQQNILSQREALENLVMAEENYDLAMTEKEAAQQELNEISSAFDSGKTTLKALEDSVNEKTETYKKAAETLTKAEKLSAAEISEEDYSAFPTLEEAGKEYQEASEKAEQLSQAADIFQKTILKEAEEKAAKAYAEEEKAKAALEETKAKGEEAIAEQTKMADEALAKYEEADNALKIAEDNVSNAESRYEEALEEQVAATEALESADLMCQQQLDKLNELFITYKVSHVGEEIAVLRFRDECIRKTGKEAEFTVKSWGNDLTHQWQVSKDEGKTWKNINSLKYPSSLTDTLTFTATEGLDGYQYRCQVSNGEKTIESEPATLVILTRETEETLTILTEPASLSVIQGETAVFSAQASDETASYTWQVSKDGGVTWSNVKQTKYPSAATSTLSFKTSMTFDGLMYRCSITKGLQQVVTKTALLTVQKGMSPVITQQPCDSPISQGQVRFAVYAEYAARYKWQVSKDNGVTWKNVTSTKYPSALTNELSFTFTSIMKGYQYRCVLTNQFGSTVSSAAGILLSAPQCLDIHGNINVKAGEVASIKVEAEGEDLNYVWQVSKDGGTTWTKVSQTKYPSAVTSELTFTTRGSMEGYMYRCYITNMQGTVYSDPLTLHVS